ncbi:helix-turn-helix domain-containing protein [Agrobacterium sp. a22-2]|uniref:ArsR/SmtB family transcription factor n=1 Tax=Agrobacterium sp. a22-2 TaxID=2283840 RepID=UPI001447B7D9|nr:SRPBCC domain-containing protein [Agrobacterium sp. a22-2]NKN36222.1 helix-turn-helix domain-containing protein [Agrobacterium sp. a22-2]
MDDIFHALAHPIRRGLLDRLRERDGQTLSELERDQPVTRFGVMKHLGVLEDAHLVVTRKVGREKLHYLNPLPVQEIADRWISRFSAPFARTLSDLATAAEKRETVMAAAAPKHVWEMFIRATPQEVWDILTDDEKTPLWQHFNMTSKTEWAAGGAITFFLGDRPMIVGKVLEIVPPSKFVHTFSAQWSPDVAVDPASRVTWTLEPIGDKACKVTLTHDDFGGDTATSKAVGGGWPEALSRLKTLAETGEPFYMPAPASA